MGRAAAAAATKGCNSLRTWARPSLTRAQSQPGAARSAIRPRSRVSRSLSAWNSATLSTANGPAWATLAKAWVSSL